MQDVRFLGQKLKVLGLRTEVTWTSLPQGWETALVTLARYGKTPRQGCKLINYSALYLSWLMRAVRTLPRQGLGRTLLTFQVNLNRMQPHFTLMEAGHRAKATYSFGSILRLYLLQPKRLRRDLRRGGLAISFFAKYYNQRLRKAYTSVVIKGYKKRYSFFLATSIAKFSAMYANNFVFFPQTLVGSFLFRRVKGIKKRLRKRLNRSVK